MSWMLMMLACGATQKNTDTNDVDALDNPEDTADPDTPPPWVPTGSGRAFFLDALLQNSLFTLEMTLITPPPEGVSYSGFLIHADGQELNLGEVPVTESTLFWEKDLGRNCLIDGYTTFEMRIDGTPIYGGSINPTIEESFSRLLVTSTETPSGQGSLREIEATLDAHIALANTAVARGEEEFTAALIDAELLFNAIHGFEKDLDDDGTISLLSDTMALVPHATVQGVADSYLVELVLSDLDAASASVNPGHPIRDLANYAYDCTQIVEFFGREAGSEVDIAANMTGKPQFNTRMNRAIDNLEMARRGSDQNEDGQIELDESSIDCAAYYVNQMAMLEINVY